MRSIQYSRLHMDFTKQKIRFASYFAIFTFGISSKEKVTKRKQHVRKLHETVFKHTHTHIHIVL